MPHKVALIPVQSSGFDADFVYQTALRSIGAFATERRHEKWSESIDYALLVPEGNRPEFKPFQSVEQLRHVIRELKPIENVTTGKVKIKTILLTTVEFVLRAE